MLSFIGHGIFSPWILPKNFVYWGTAILLAAHRDYRCMVKTFFGIAWKPKAFGSGGSNLQWINDSRELRVEVLSCVTMFSFKYLSSCSLSGWSKLCTMLTSKLEKLSQYGRPTIGINIRFSAKRSQVYVDKWVTLDGTKPRLSATWPPPGDVLGKDFMLKT